MALVRGGDRTSSESRFMNHVKHPDNSGEGTEPDLEEAVIGLTPVMQDPVFLPDASLRSHWLIVGRPRTGKSTLVKHLTARKLELKADGRDRGAVVVVDTHGGTTGGILQLVPQNIVDKVRFLDFGRRDRVPRLNLLDPNLFPDRDRAVSTIVETCNHFWSPHDGSWVDVLRNFLLLLYEFNRHPGASAEEMAGILDIPALLDHHLPPGQSMHVPNEVGPSLDDILSRVDDSRLQGWFRDYATWYAESRNRTVAPIRNHLGLYSSNPRTAAIFGRGKSTVDLSTILDEGLIALVSADPGLLGPGPAALLGGSVVTMTESALRRRGSPAEPNKDGCLLVCDELPAVPGPDWEVLLSDIHRYGCGLVLATQSVAGEGVRERSLRGAMLYGLGSVAGFRMSAEDAGLIAAQLAGNRAEARYLVNQGPFQCYLRLETDRHWHSVCPMSLLRPPEWQKRVEGVEDRIVAAAAEYTVGFA